MSKRLASKKDTAPKPVDTKVSTKKRDVKADSKADTDVDDNSKKTVGSGGIEVMLA